jgi:hypothetical protein
VSKIITRKWIRPDSVFHTANETYTFEQLALSINHWKERLLKERITPGQKIGIAIPSYELSYLAITFAAFELGLKMVILTRPMNEKDCVSAKCLAHLPLDMFIYGLPDAPEYNFAVDFFIRHSWKSIRLEPNYVAFSDNDVGVYATPDSDLLLCTSSGTTGKPKLISQTHSFLYDLCSMNWEQLGFNQDDSAIHLESFNHGSSICIFFLPSMLVCKEHYLFASVVTDADKGYYYNVMKFCERKGITKILSPNGLATDSLLSTLESGEIDASAVTMMILSFINPKWLNAVKSGSIKKIVSVFGCSETGGPLFLPYIDKNTEKFDPRSLGKPCNDFYKITTPDNMLTVKMPDGRVIETGDYVTEDFYFVRKNKLPRINDIDINSFDLIELLERKYSRSRFEIVVDEISNLLYIVTEDESMLSDCDIGNDISSFYMKRVELADIIHIPNLGDMSVSIKPDHGKLLEYINNRT